MKTKILSVALVLCLAVTGTAFASGGVAFPRWVLSGGASDSAGSGGTTLRATLGQPVAGVVSSNSGDITLGQGFWYGATSDYIIYLPLIMHNL